MTYGIADQAVDVHGRGRTMVGVNGTVVVRLIRCCGRRVHVIGIVASRADPASVTIAEQLRQVADFSRASGAERWREFELRMFEERHLDLEDVASHFEDPELVVFVSRHAGDTGPLLTAHVPGNVGTADYGGQPRTVPRAAPAALRTVYHALRGYAPSGYDVGLECTHHGPSRVGAPCLFVEVGSDESAWRDPVPARSVARAVLEIDPDPVPSDRVIVGFGGEHYVPRYERIVRDTDWAVGHIAADWALTELAETEDRAATISSLFEQSHATMAHVDSSENWVRPTIEKLGYRIVSERWLREANGVDLDLIDRITDQLGSVEDGTRIGERTSVDPSELQIHRLHNAFVDLLNGTDPERARRCFRQCTTAYTTIASGSRIGPEVALPSHEGWDDLITCLHPLFDERFDEFAVTNGVIVGTTTRFDPTTARSLGVPDGPAFGRLAAGESITVDGATVDPADVHVTERVAVPMRSSN